MQKPKDIEDVIGEYIPTFLITPPSKQTKRPIGFMADIDTKVWKNAEGSEG